MTVRARLIAGTIAMTLLLAVLTAAAGRVVWLVSTGFQVVAEENLPEIETLHALQFAGLRVVSSTSEIALILTQGRSGAGGQGGAQREEALIQGGATAYDSVLRRYAQLVEGTDEVHHLVAITAAGQRLLATSDELVRLARRGAAAAEVLEKKEELEETEEAFLDASGTAIANESRDFAAGRADVEAAVARAGAAVVGAGLGIVLVSLLLGMGVVRSITRPLDALVASAQRLASGELGARAPAGRRDELGTLAEAFNEMAGVLQRSFEAVRRSEEDYRGLFRNAADGVLRLEEGGQVLAGNQALVRMLRYSSEGEVLALRAQDLFVDAADYARVLHGASTGSPARLECRWRRSDGTAVTVRIAAHVGKGRDGATASLDMIVEDVTERRALEEQLRQAQKMEAIGQLTGGIAHDLNNVLTVIQANAELIAPVIPASAVDVHSDLLELQAATRRASDMIRKLLAFSRREMLRLRPTDLGRLVADLADTLRRLIPASVDIRTTVAPDLPTLLVDPGAVEQIVINLATNARDAMPNGGLLQIAVEHRRVDDGFLAVHGVTHVGRYVCLSISDNGAGMDDRTKAHLFEPFFTTKPQGKGTGLGMAMVHGLTRQHDGFVNVYSELGRGTVVRVYLPVSEAGDHEARPVQAGELVGGTETILLVEDEEPVRRAGKRALERFGYTVLTAHDGLQALEMLRAGEPAIHLVMSDIVMPRMGGRELLSAVRQERLDVTVMLSSGYSARDLSESAELDPTVPFLHKPWTLTELVAGVRRVLDDVAADQRREPDG